jgi:hypothetical protein
MNNVIDTRPKRSELTRLFGTIINGNWADEEKHMGMLRVPLALQPPFPAHIYCNKAMESPLALAFANISALGLAGELKSFDGCFNIRASRGLPTLSNHSYGLAIDLNAAENPLGGETTLSPALVKCFTEAGFVWGGTWLRRDPMHFQYVTEDQ